MPIYHINVRTESHIADTHTVDLEGLTAARIEMARFVGELLGDHADLIRIDQDQQVDVTDEFGLILYVRSIQEPFPRGMIARLWGEGSQLNLVVEGQIQRMEPAIPAYFNPDTSSRRIVPETKAQFIRGNGLSNLTVH